LVEVNLKIKNLKSKTSILDFQILDFGFHFGGFMNDKRIEYYLRKSTRGLWGRKCEEVREELSAHIEGRIHAHLIGGLSESEAVEKTLTELGHPTDISSGMTRIYTLPIVAGSSMALAMCCALVVVLLSGSTAQTLQTTDIFPVDECLESEETVLPYYCNVGGWTNIEDLKKALEPQGVTFETKGINWYVTFPGGRGVLLDTTSIEYFFDGELEDDEITLRPKPDFILIRQFIESLTVTNLPLRLKGWDKPVLHVGDVTLEIDLTKKNPDAYYGSESFYYEALNMGVSMDLPQSDATMNWVDTSKVPTEQKRFKVTEPEGTVYGILAIVNTNTNGEDARNPGVYTDIGRVSADGYVTLTLPREQPLTFLSTATAVYKEGLAIFVRLSGDMGGSASCVIIPPDEIRLEP
jgi:hypothetical protein